MGDFVMAEEMSNVDPEARSMGGCVEVVSIFSRKRKINIYEVRNNLFLGGNWRKKQDARPRDEVERPSIFKGKAVRRKQAVRMQPALRSATD